MNSGNVTRVWLPLALGLVFISLVFFSSASPHGVGDSLGLVLSLIGLAGVIHSRYTLGKSFSVRAKAVSLVTTGLYSRIRNPVYISGILLAAGVFLILHQSAVVALVVVIIPIQIIRARREAVVLEARFGEEYRVWRRNTWF